MDTLLDECDNCKGGGFVHPIRDGHPDYSDVTACGCQKDKIQEQRHATLLRYCDLPPMSEDMRFDNFERYESVNTAYSIAKKVASDTEGLHWVTFMGFNDTGKTHLAVAICRAWIDKGVIAKYAFVPLLLDELREGFKREGSDSYTERFNRLCNIPLLVLDDLGAESTTSWVNEKLESLVDFRYMNKLSLVVTTNKSIEELSSRLGSRLVRHPSAEIVWMGNTEHTTWRINKGK